MTATGTIAPYRSEVTAGRDGFGALLRAEWAKFRTVRGWVIGMIIAALLMVGIALLDHSSCGGTVTPGGPVVAGSGCSVPVGPGGEAVTDSFYFVHQPLAGNGTITARLTSLTGQTATGAQIALDPWSKAGIIVTAGTKPGSAYAAMIVTPGHGARMQYDYTGDLAGLPGAVSATNPRWLRLTRAGDRLTGYDSVDGTHWTRVGAVTLAGLPSTAQAGLLAAAPASSQLVSHSLTGSSQGGQSVLASASFDHVSLSGQHPGGAWSGDTVGGGPGGGAGGGPGPGGPGAAKFHRSGGTLTVSGSGDIAPDVPAAPDGGGTAPERTLLGVFGGLIAVIIVATMFMTAEYRRGLIRVTFSATPGRGRVLAAKAVVIGAVTFVAGLAGALVALPLGERLLRSNGNYILPVSALTEVRLVAGTAALLAVAAVFAVGLATILRHGWAVTPVLMMFLVPYLLGVSFPVLPAGAAAWLLRVTPAAGFAIQQSLVRYPQVSGTYTPGNGYFPLAPWAGFAVLCGYAAVALAAAVILLRRRDA